MSNTEQVQLFEGLKVRTVWDDVQEKWYFSVADAVQVLTDSVNPSDYIKKMRKRDPELSKGWGQIVTPLLMHTEGGPQKANCADLAGILRIIQSIPSKKAEPFKMWMAQVAERGGSVARVAKEAFEKQTGKKVVSDINAKQFLESGQPELPFEGEDTGKR